MQSYEARLLNSIIGGNLADVQARFSESLDPNFFFHYNVKPGMRTTGKTVLEVAAELNQTAIVREIISHGCDPDAVFEVPEDGYMNPLVPCLRRDRLKLTALYKCLVRGQTEMVEILVHAGADVNMPDDRGSTALWHAVDQGSKGMVETILSDPACNVNVPDHIFLCPLHVAAIRKKTAIASLLLDRGAVVDALQIRRSTPLILACRCDAFGTAWLLLLHGANPNHCDTDGQTPLSAALRHSSSDRLERLLMLGGARVHRGLVEAARQMPSIAAAKGELLNSMAARTESPLLLQILCSVCIRQFLAQSKTHISPLQAIQQLSIAVPLQDFLLLKHLG